MKRYIKHAKILVALAVGFVVLVVGFLFSGIYNIGANDQHYPIVYRALETLRDRSIAVRSKAIEVPDLSDAALIRQGAGNYHAMCTGCHLMPGMAESEMHNGLYPQPPNLTRERVDPKRAFWVIKNGIKASGMPSWGKSMEDRYLWGLVAFQQKLPELTPQAYQEMVAQSGGHSHGGGETGAAGGHDEGAGHKHGEGAEMGHSHGTTMPASGESPAHDDHDGHSHSHGAEGEKPASDAHDDGDGHSHDHAPSHSDGHSHEHGTNATASAMAAPAGPAEVVERFQSALVAGDLARAEALLDPQVKIFEGGNIERSRTEYAEGHMKHDAVFLKSAKITPLSQTGDAMGDLAWVGTERRMSATHDDKLIDVVSTETMVLKRAAEGWRIAHIHWSSRPAASKH